jgi:hypothetical protein
MGRALGLAAASVLVAPLLLAPAAGAQVPPGGSPPPPPTGPVAELDPVLDDVPVGDTPAVAAAGRRYADAVRTEGEAGQRVRDAEGERDDLIARSTDASADVVAAEGALAEAEREVVRQEDELEERIATTARTRDQLTIEEDGLRAVVTSAFTSKPADSLAVVGTFDQMTAGERRQDIRDRAIDVQSRFVEEADRRWREARGAEAAQRRRLARTEEAREARRAELEAAIVRRDDLNRLVGEAEQRVRDRQAELVAAGERRAEALVARRESRLLAPVSGLDLTLVGLHAYWRASASSPCPIPWWLLAGIGKVETGHGTAQGNEVLATGTTSGRILGIPLDGRPGVAAIGDTDGGALDSDVVWDRAVGPMQFIPGTWRAWARDGNSDGASDPHNLYDTAAAAANYLCFGRGGVTDEPNMRAALFSYNQSGPYGDKVLAEARRYQAAVALPDLAPPTAEDITPHP